LAVGASTLTNKIRIERNWSELNCYTMRLLRLVDASDNFSLYTEFLYFNFFVSTRDRDIPKTHY
jgi:hypothetical protein